MSKNSFLHFSKNDRFSKQMIGVELSTEKDKSGKRNIYIANNGKESKKYKTLNGAEKFLKKQGYKQIALDDKWTGQRHFSTREIEKHYKNKKQPKLHWDK